MSAIDERDKAFLLNYPSLENPTEQSFCTYSWRGLWSSIWLEILNFLREAISEQEELHYGVRI